MSIPEIVAKTFPVGPTSVMLASLGVLLIMDWVQIVQGDKDTHIKVTVAASAGWLIAVVTGVIGWTQ